MNRASPSKTKRVPRHRCILTAQLLRGGADPLECQVLDLSCAGAFLESSADLQVGDSFLLRIRLPTGALIPMRATVTRLGSTQREVEHPRVRTLTTLRPGVGVRFDTLPPTTHARLMSFIARLDER